MISAFEVLEHLGIPAFVVEVVDDRSFLYRKVNGAFVALSGQPASHWCGKPVEAGSEGGDKRRAIRRHIRKVFTSRVASSYVEEVAFRTGTHHLWTTLSPYQGSSEYASFVIGSSVDLMGQQQCLESLISDYKNAQTRALRCEERVSIARHDFKAPIRNIKALAEILLEELGDADESKKRTLDMLVELTERSWELSKEAFAPDSGHVISKQCFNLKELCDNVAGIIDPAGQLVVHAADTELLAERFIVQSVLRNWIENTRSGENTVSLSVSAVPKPDQMVEIIVTDNAMGRAERKGHLLRYSAGCHVSQYDSVYGLFALDDLVKSVGGGIVTEENSAGTGVTMRLTLPGELIAQPDNGPRSTA